MDVRTAFACVCIRVERQTLKTYGKKDPFRFLLFFHDVFLFDVSRGPPPDTFLLLLHFRLFPHLLVLSSIFIFLFFFLFLRFYLYTPLP